MKKLIALSLAVASLLCCLVGCSETIKEYDKTPLTSLTYTEVDYNGGFTTEYLFDFDKNVMTKHSFLPEDEENDRTETLAEFSDEQEKTLIDRLYTYGLFDIKEEYKSPPGIVDGGGWTLQINYNDGTSKTSSGSNNTPKSVFSDCAKAFYDICGDGVVARVPTEYHTPPNVSYAIHTTVGSDTTSQGATSLTQRGNYKWNGFEENSLDYFQLNQNYSFPYALDENAEYGFVLYTANYGDYDRFKKCEVFSYNCDDEMSGEETVVDKGWFDQVEFNLKTNKIYVIKLSFKNGDFVEYTFNTSVAKNPSGCELLDEHDWQIASQLNGCWYSIITYACSICDMKQTAEADLALPNHSWAEKTTDDKTTFSCTRCNESNTFIGEIQEFSYAQALEEYKIGDPGVKHENFNNPAVELETTGAIDAITRAKFELTIEYDIISVSYDKTSDMWRVDFWTLNLAGNGQSVYVNGSGLTCYVVYGE